MRSCRNALLALFLGIFAPLVIWVAGGVALYQLGVVSWGRKKRGSLRAMVSDLTCSADADCPSGYVCVNGCCLPEM